MSKLRRAFGMALIALTAISLVAADSASADTGGDEMDFVARINGLRASKGLAPLAAKGELFDVARAWSNRMAGAGAMSHNPGLSSQLPSEWKHFGENVGMGFDVPGLQEAFVNSPTHYANMVNPVFTSVGVGVVRNGPDLFVTTIYMTGGGSAPAAKLVRKVVRVCSKNRKGRTVCIRKVQMVRA